MVTPETRAVASSSFRSTSFLIPFQHELDLLPPPPSCTDPPSFSLLLPLSLFLPPFPSLFLSVRNVSAVNTVVTVRENLKRTNVGNEQFRSNCTNEENVVKIETNVLSKLREVAIQRVDGRGNGKGYLRMVRRRADTNRFLSTIEGLRGTVSRYRSPGASRFSSATPLFFSPPPSRGWTNERIEERLSHRLSSRFLSISHCQISLEFIIILRIL